MKVVQVLPALELGGVERGTLDLAKYLVNSGHQSIVISAGGRLVSQLEQEGSHHVTWDVGRKSVKTFLEVSRLRKWLEKESPDIVHVRSRLPAWITWLAWRKMPVQARPRFVTTQHGMHSVSWYSSIMLKGEVVIAVSEVAKNYLSDNYSQAALADIRVVHRGIDIEVFNELNKPSSEWIHRFDKQFSIDKNIALIGFPGRLTSWKGHDELLDIATKLLKTQNRFCILVVGSGSSSYQKNLKQKISDCNLDNHIKLIGSRDDMNELYHRFDLTLSLTSSTAETFGRTIVESLSCGTPVVGYDYGGVHETLSVLFPWGKVPVFDQDAIVLKINQILNNPDQIPKIYDNSIFTLDNMCKSTMNIYKELVAV